MQVARINSRYGTVRVLERLNENTYRMSGETLYHRISYCENGDGIADVDFEGGPFVQLNDAIKFYGAKDDRRISKIEIDEKTGEKNLIVNLTVA